MHTLKNDILIDKLSFSFSRNSKNLCSRIYQKYDNLLAIHNGSLITRLKNCELEFNPSYNDTTGHNLENLPESQLKNILFDLFGIPPQASMNELLKCLSEDPLDIVKIKRIHLTKDYMCTDDIDKYLNAVESIRPKILSPFAFRSLAGGSVYFARGINNGSDRSRNFEIKFYNKTGELKQDYGNNLSEMPFLGTANAPLSTINGCYDLSQQDILRIEIAINNPRNRHVIPFNDFMTELHSGNLYSRLEKEYGDILFEYVFNASSGKKPHGNWKRLLNEISTQQDIDFLFYRTLFEAEGMSKSRLKAFNSFTSALPNKYASEIINCL